MGYLMKVYGDIKRFFIKIRRFIYAGANIRNERGIKTSDNKKRIIEEFKKIYFDSQVWKKTHWFRTPVQKCPTDLWIYQEIINEIKPDVIITWNSFHRHPDHRSIAQLLIDAVQMARIPRIVSPNGPHRSDIVILQYYDERALLPSLYVDITDSIDKVREVTQCYADTYGWTGAVEAVTTRRRSLGMECDVQYAERFTVLRRRYKAVRYVI